MPGLKSQVVFAPAGSGKTERLSRRYIELLEAGVPPERILTLTFTEKAAAEMKERIFQRLADKNPDLHQQLRRNALRLRIGTIHSFCLTLVRRFAPNLGLDPRVDVLTAEGELWNAAKYDTLMTIAESRGDRQALELLLDLITTEDRIGWEALSRQYDHFFARRVNIARGRVRLADRAELARVVRELRADPRADGLDDPAAFPDELTPATVSAALTALYARRDLFMNARSDTPRLTRAAEREWNEICFRYYSLLRQDAAAAEFARSFELFRTRFLDTYTRRKREAGQVDYDDMESLALDLLRQDPDWQNVLRAFDEHTDHLLVDEFQDTSFLQWGIVDKLTEEWRSGQGIKTELGIEPTIFIVGDDKQSIYGFREAKVEVFTGVADELEKGLGPERLERLTLEDNYRSLEAIINFNNVLFSRLMACESDAPAWRTRYKPFRRARNNAAPGRVEVIITPSGKTVAERRVADACAVARRIRALTDPAVSCPTRVPAPFTVYDRNPDGTETGRPCTFGDIGILVRQHKTIPFIEAALRDCGVPFLVAGGTGFYHEPEVRYAIALLAALVDPADDLALYATLRGPVFDIPEADLLLSGIRGRDRNPPGNSGSCPLDSALADLERWRARIAAEPLALVLEEALTERRAWQAFWEPQRQANLRRLLAIIEDRAADGEAPLRILCALQDPGDDAKAAVRTEGVNAVQILTVHTAKGLQFPVAFFPAQDESIKPLEAKSGSQLVIEEVSADEVEVSWLSDAGLRRQSNCHMTHREKEIEEEKRVFYVACTRARDALFLTGAYHEKGIANSRLLWLIEHLGLDPVNLSLDSPDTLPGVTVTNGAELGDMTGIRPGIQDRVPGIPKPAPPPPDPAPTERILPVTRNLARDFTRLSDEAIHTGELIHRILELISQGVVDPGRLPEAIEHLLAGLPAERRRYILDHLDALRADAEAWSIVTPQENAEAELPVMYTDGETLRTGRVDRVIITPDEVRIYDYKTFPVRPREIGTLAREYHDGQLRHYVEALRRIYQAKKVSTFLLFTALPRIVETGTL
ncbi:MAG: UvrD-helicase domain-containing protein [bacterium]